MKSIHKLVLVLACASTLTACVPAVRTYVDPQYHHATYDTVHRLEQPIPVKVDAQFEVNGAPRPAADTLLQTHVLQVLRASGVLIPTDSPVATSEISVLANDLADIGSARTKGFGTGLTFGAVGSVVPDNYEFTITYRGIGATKYQGTYQHRLITTMGHADGPAFAVPTTPDEGFRQVVEDALLNFIQDMQDKGVVPK
ncbi:MAG TPA: hypothetical protein VGC19_00845 [Rhodanobacter sp.]